MPGKVTIQSIALTTFRNYAEASLAFDGRHVVLTGDNGSGGRALSSVHQTTKALTRPTATSTESAGSAILRNRWSLTASATTT